MIKLNSGRKLFCRKFDTKPSRYDLVKKTIPVHLPHEIPIKHSDFFSVSVLT